MTQNARRRGRHRLGLVFVGGVIAFAALLFGLRLYELNTERSEAVERAENENRAFVTVLAQYAERTIGSFESTFEGIAIKTRRAGWKDADASRWNNLLAASVTVSGEILSLDITNADGIVLISTRDGAVGKIFMDRSILAQTTAADKIVLGPMRSCTQCAVGYVFTISKRLDGPGGAENAMMIGYIDPARLQEVAYSLGEGFGGYSEIVLDGGGVLIQAQPVAAGPGPVDVSRFLIDRSGAAVVLPWDLDARYVIAYRYIPAYGVFAIFAREKSAALAYWEASSRQSVATGVVMLAICIIGAVVFFRLLRTRERDDKQMAIRRAELENIQSSAKMAGFRWYPDRNVLVPSHAALASLGLADRGSEWRSIGDLLHLFPEREAQELHEATLDCHRMGATHRLELSGRPDPDGRVPYYSITMFRREAGDQADPTPGGHVFLVVQDMTEWQEMRTNYAHLMKMDAVGQLTGGIAHDFNNLLVVILGNIEDLSAEFPKGDPRSKLFDATLGAVLQARDVTKRLLTFARRQPLQPISVEVHSLMEGMRTLLARTIGEHVTLLFEEDNEFPPWNVKADRSLLETSLLNLVINARDAMGQGGTIRIRARNRTVTGPELTGQDYLLPGEYVDLMVQDDGVGMPPEVVLRSIEPYFTTKPIGVGSGMGLSQVYGFVKQSGGHFQIDSEVGGGTTVHMYMPRAKLERRSSAVQPELDDEMALGPATETILVVEDDEAVRNHVNRVLSSLGYKVIVRVDGTAVSALVDDGVHFDLLLTDVMLPGGTTGRQVARMVQERRPNVPVLYMSGYAPEIIDEYGVTSADMLFIQKPFLRAELARTVRSALEGAGA